MAFLCFCLASIKHVLEKKLYMYVKINLTAMTNFYIFLLISTKYVDNTVTF